MRTRRSNTIHIVIDNDVLERYNKVYFEQHPRAKKKPVPHPYHESINTWMILKRVAMNSLKQRWKVFITWLANDLGLAGRMIEKCMITQTVYYPINSRHDTDNSVPKFILDGFVEAGVIVDDDMRHLNELRLRCDISKEHPRTEFDIHIIEN